VRWLPEASGLWFAGPLIFLKAFKALSAAVALMPLIGCSGGLGLVFAGLLRGFSYAPDLEDSLFGHAMLGFALIETFMVVAIAIIGLVFSV
jgi:F0F1-type ATP synthase membrane subunit c/vacuolar-type H+-ATPase subunit K